MRTHVITGAAALCAAVLATPHPALAQEPVPPPEATEPLAPSPETDRGLQEVWDAIFAMPSAFNPRLTIAADLLGRTSVGSNDLIVLGDDEDGDGFPDPVNADDRVYLRELEFRFGADIERWADATVIAAIAEHHPGEYEVELEEAFVTLRGLPAGWPEGLTVKAGRFRTALGWLNALHTHDLPHPTRPWAFAAFLGEEGMRDNGLSVAYALPLGSALLTTTVEGINGEDEVLLAGGDQDFPALVVATRLAARAGPVDVELGLSGLMGFRDEPRRRRGRLGVVDFLVRWRSPSDPQSWSLLFGGEAFLTDLDDLASGHRSIDSGGGYLWAHVQLEHAWYVGGRVDWTREPVANRDRMSAWSVWVSWYPAELLRFRVGYENAQRPGDTDLQTLFFGLTFAIGAHPPHPHLHAHPHAPAPGGVG